MKASLEHNSMKCQRPHFILGFHVFGISCLWLFVICNFRGRWGPVRSPFDVTNIWPSPMTPMLMTRNIVMMIEITNNVKRATMQLLDFMLIIIWTVHLRRQIRWHIYVLCIYKCSVWWLGNKKISLATFETRKKCQKQLFFFCGGVELVFNTSPTMCLSCCCQPQTMLCWQCYDDGEDEEDCIDQ